MGAHARGDPTTKRSARTLDDVAALSGVDLDVADRQLAVVVGPSGCGKSPLLRLIAGLEEITSGDLWIDGERMKALFALLEENGLSAGMDGKGVPAGWPTAISPRPWALPIS